MELVLTYILAIAGALLVVLAAVFIGVAIAYLIKMMKEEN